MGVKFQIERKQKRKSLKKVIGGNLLKVFEKDVDVICTDLFKKYYTC